MADSYTRGGWAKLDRDGSVHLAEIIATFPKAKLMQDSKMLLLLYASMGKGGTITIGHRQLAEAAGVSDRAAYRFMKKLEDDGMLIRVGDSKGQSGGKYMKRAFWWIADSIGDDQKQADLVAPPLPKTVAPPLPNRGDLVAPPLPKPPQNGSTSDDTEYQMIGGALWLAPSARPADNQRGGAENELLRRARAKRDSAAMVQPD